MNPYPKPFDPGSFPALPDAVKPKPPKIPAVIKSTVDVTHSIRIPSVNDAVVTALWIESRTDSSMRSLSFQNREPETNPVLDPANHFSFLPGVDRIWIKWKSRRWGKATKLLFELYSAQKPAAIWTKEYTGGSAADTLKGTSDNGKGRLAWSEVSVAVDAPLFPDGRPTVAGAAYQMRLTVTGQNGAVTSAWTYFDVLVHKIELHWGPQAMVPPGNITDVLPIYQAVTTRDEQALLANLQNPNTLIDPNQALQLRLKSLNAAYVHLNEWYMWRDMSFLRFKGRWGDGPRLPIVARIYLKSLDNPAGVHSAEAAKALGPAEFLWDWRDKTEAVRTNEMNAYNVDARTFILAALKYKENAAGEPPACLNCHADRGGKRGGAKRVLPEFNSPATFPFEVARPATRTWGALSKALTTGANACCTGVLFQSSRMALDSYRLRIFLATAPFKPTLDVAGTMDTLVTNHPGLPTEKTGMMEVLRQVDAQYVRKGTQTARADLNAVATEYRKGGIVVVWAEPVWGQAQYTALMTQAVAPNATGEDATYVRSRVFRTNCRARRTGLTNWNDPVKAEIANYDQWFGCIAGQVQPNESAAQFTVPGRDVVVDRYIASVVASFIDDALGFYPRKRKWNKFRQQNLAVALPVLRVRFFNQVLTQGQRTKLLVEICNRYQADGWLGWGRPATQPEEWADDNYNYRLKKLVYLSDEMHLRKVLADAFEGVTVFHYRHFFDAVNANDTLYARQSAIGGVAAISMTADLGLSGAFTVWDHPTNLQRQVLSRIQCVRRNTTPQGVDGHTGNLHNDCTFKDGNATIVHEFGHFLHLPHARPTGGADEARMHDQADAKCIMNYDPDALHLCGSCLLRLRGWAFFNSKGMLGYDNTNPANAGCAPPIPTIAGLPDLLDNFYTDFA